MGKRRKETSRSHRLIWVVLLFLFLLLFFVADSFVHLPNADQDAWCGKLPNFIAQQWVSMGNFAANITDNLRLTGKDNFVLVSKFSLPGNQILCAGIPIRKTKAAPADFRILKKKGFVIGYSPSLRHPVWVAYQSFPTDNYYPGGERPPFKQDPQAPNCSHPSHFAKSGYDRGHMAPNLAIARRYGRDGQRDTFYTSNICPQRPSLNRGPWCDLELRISEIWPPRYGSVWTIVGAIPNPENEKLKGPSAPIRNGIDLPIGFYQIILVQRGNRILSNAVYMPQNVRYKAHARSYLVSIDELEDITGFDFFSDLPDELEKELEANKPTRLLPSGFIGLCKILYQRYRY